MTTRKAAMQCLIALVAGLVLPDWVHGAAATPEKSVPARRPVQKTSEREAVKRPLPPVAPAVEDISDNPSFKIAKEVILDNPSLQDLDGIVRPVLAQVFKDAKIIAKDVPIRNSEPGTLNMLYMVRRLFAREDAGALHEAFVKAHFARTARYGAKPTVTNSMAIMSLAKTTSRRGYSIGVIMDFNAQTIRVEAYPPGSKYDRLM